MPLHPERKARGIRDADRLDSAVLGDAFDDDAFARLEDTLPVQRIDADGRKRCSAVTFLMMS